MRQSLRVCLALSTSLALGCATIVSKSTYPVQINSQPADAEVTVKDEHGSVLYSGTTPATVQLKAGAGYFKGANYTVTFEKSGYAKHSATIARSVDVWYAAGNLVIGGILGYLVIDPATGAMWKLEHVNVTLEPGSAQLLEGDVLRIATLDQVPRELVPHLIPIE